MAGKLRRSGLLEYELTMQVLQAGQHKFLLLELDTDLIVNLVKQAGFDYRLDDTDRTVSLELTIPDRQAPLLLFDASDPGNLGWFSRCQFYVSGQTGAVLQTPISVANQKDRSGSLLPQGIRIQIAKELPASFRLPGRQPITEESIYAVLFNFLNALLNVGVGVCGGPIVRPLAGRTERVGSRN